ncbi:MAG: hypothetical protein ACM3MD_03535 [Betaproteobacteria bacterium]
MTHSFRHSAGFGKRIEYWIIGQMLKEGLDICVPLVDDDAVIRKPNGHFIIVQIKARSKDVIDKNAGEKIEYCKKQFEKYVAKDFQRLIAGRTG